MENKLYLSQTKRQQNSVLVTEEEINEKLLASNTLVNIETCSPYSFKSLKA